MVAGETLTTSKPLSTTAPPAGKLQRLGFIPTYTTFAYGYASHAYVVAKKYVPAGLKPQVESAENLYSKNVQPIVAKFTDGGKEILLVLDNRVRGRLAADTVYFVSRLTYQKAARPKLEYIPRIPMSGWCCSRMNVERTEVLAWTARPM